LTGLLSRQIFSNGQRVLICQFLFLISQTPCSSKGYNLVIGLVDKRYQMRSIPTFIASSTLTARSSTKRLISKSGIDAQNAHLINKINKQNRCLSVLGILPSHLRILTRNSIKEYDKALTDISKTLFWKGYAIWTKRKVLIADYWKNIAREEWKVHKSKKQISETKKRKLNIKALYQCSNPFHFLEKSGDLSHQMPTPCPCSRNCLAQADLGSNNIQSFFHIYQLQSRILSTLTLVRIGYPVTHHVTRQNTIRREHDRGKKRKKE
jgi:hypothetical protein